TPVVVEGYGPPSDPRLASLSVTPDPGVIEVNVQPTASFAEQSELLESLYEHARHVRLGTETFDLDGSDGADLHGKHLLPHYVIQDIALVAEELREAGYPFETAWLDPFTEFRFPRLGTVQIRDQEIELRGAIE